MRWGIAQLPIETPPSAVGFSTWQHQVLGPGPSNRPQVTPTKLVMYEVQSTMIDNETLRARLQTELDKLGLTGEVAEQLVRELNFLACLLIGATEEGGTQ